ncbi:MAG TPA: helix-turn-helix transcriptional regulator [Dictyobacter sp.]|nr:helix-turn-helix transcriptional regulator [Dictyobacter sp.]
MESKSFGELVKTYRKQRYWKQEDLAQSWGYSREYISQIEQGKRKLTNDEQVRKLANILEIPIEQLERIGKVPARIPTPVQPQEGDNALFSALLSPAQTTIKLSWLVWHGNSAPEIHQQLQDLIVQLETALTLYRGQFVKQALELQAYAHEMLGSMAFDQLDLQTASYHYQEMYDIGEELQHPDLITLASVHQADILRKRNRLETALSRFTAAEEQKWVEHASLHVQGLFYQVRARTYTIYASENDFLRNIEKAEAIAHDIPRTITTEADKFDLVEVLQEKAQGYTILWKPEEALKLYQQTDQMRPYRPLRDQGSYTIVKAQAHTYNGDIRTGIDYALRGIELAQQYHSKRHIKRLQGMYDRLSVTKIGKHPLMKDLRTALIDASK